MAYVRLITPAVNDLEALAAKDPQILRMVLKKMLLLEQDPNAGDPLVGPLIGWRRLVVGDRDWRIVWRNTTDDTGTDIIEIAEVWAAGARADGAVYAEVESRIAELGDAPEAVALTAIVETLAKHAGTVTPTPEPVTDPVPKWLADRLIHTARVPPDKVAALTGEAAMALWEQYLTNPH